MAKKHFTVLCLALLITVSAAYCLPITLVAAVDPLYILRDHDGDMEHFIGDQRYWIPGAIRQYLFHNRSRSNVAVGSSLMQNANAKDMERFAGLPEGMVITTPGLTPEEFSLIFALLRKAPWVENIVYTLDHLRYFKTSPPPGVYFPAGLYGDSFTAKLEEMIRMDVIRMAFRMLRGKERVRDLDSRSAVMQRATGKHAFSQYALGYERSVATHEKRAAALAFPEDDVAFDPSAVDFGIALFRTVPDGARLHLLIAPSFLGAEDLFLDYADYYHGLLRLTHALRDKKNITIYGFDDIPAITNNMANFLDNVHYGIGVTRYMFKAVGARKHVITENNVQEYLARVWENRKHGTVYNDPGHTVSFEGPLDEKAFQNYPFPDGPSPLQLPEQESSRAPAYPPPLLPDRYEHVSATRYEGLFTHGTRGVSA